MKRIKSVLIVGGSGFLGSHLAMRMRDDFKVFATYFFNQISIPGITYLPFDALKKDWVKRVAYTAEPDIIIYAAGKDDVAWAEDRPKDADRIHTSGAVSVLTNSDILQPKYIYISNSYVFDGKKGNYKEKDVVLPGTALGKTKLSSENYVKGRSLNHIIVRPSPMIGVGTGKNFSFIDRLRIALGTGQTIELDNNELHSFAPIYGFTELIMQLSTSGIKNKVLHYGGLTRMTYFQLGKAFAKRFGFNEKLIHPKIIPGRDSFARPEWDFSLNSTHAVEMLKIKPFLLEQSFDLLNKHLVP